MEDPPFDIPCGVYANDDIKIATILGEDDKWIIHDLEGNRLPDPGEYHFLDDAVFKIVDLVEKRQPPFIKDFGLIDTIDGKRLVKLFVLAEAEPSPDFPYTVYADDTGSAGDFHYNEGYWTIQFWGQRMLGTAEYATLKEAVAAVIEIAKLYPLLVRKNRSGNLRSPGRIFGKRGSNTRPSRR